MNKISHMYNIFFKLKRFYLNSYVLGYWTLMIFTKKERKRKRNRERVSSIEKITRLEPLMTSGNMVYYLFQFCQAAAAVFSCVIH